jgi:hypothetical protein
MSRKARLTKLERHAVSADGDGMPEIELEITEPTFPTGTRVPSTEWPMPDGPVRVFLVGTGQNEGGEM